MENGDEVSKTTLKVGLELLAADSSLHVQMLLSVVSMLLFAIKLKIATKKIRST